MASPDVAALHQRVADKYRKVAESPAGLFKHPTGEASGLALREVFRALKPSGRFQACDMSLAGDEPPPDKSPWSD